MPNFTLPISIVDDLVEVYRGAVPQDVASQNRRLDDARTIAKVLSAGEAVVADWARSIVISTAQGVALDALGDGEGLHRQGGETDDVYRPRLRTPPDAQTRTAILASIQQIVDANGGGAIYMKELPMDAAFLGDCYFNRNDRMGAARVRMVIVQIPASANCRTAALDILRAKVSAAKEYSVEEYTR